jgi:flagellar biogenesis protein FliO
MGVVVAGLLGAVWLYRNWQRFLIKGGRTPKLQVLESKSLGPRHGLYVIGYEQQRFLIASAPTGISLLTSLPPGTPDEVQAPVARPQVDFAAILSRTLSFGGKSGGAEA